MKKFFIITLAYWLIITLVSCNGNAPSAATSTGVFKPGERYLGVVTNPNGSRTVEDIFFHVKKGVDSNDKVVKDTFLLKWIFFYDSLGRPEKRLVGKDSTTGYRVVVPKDSVTLNITGVPIDSLLKASK